MKIEVTEELSEGGFPYQVIHVPNMLRLKTGPLSINNPKEAAAAAAVAAMCERQAGYVVDLVGSAVKDWSQARDASVPKFDQLRVVLHELRGISANFGYPLLEHIAAAAASILESGTTGELAKSVIDAHIRSLSVVVTEKIVGDGGAVGRALQSSLADARAKLQG